MATNGNGPRDSKRRAAIAALLTAPNVASAAAAAGVGERTLFRWLDDPAFTAELRQAEEAAIDAATRQLISLASDAGAVIGEVLQNPRARDTTRLRAAALVLDHLLKLRELRDVEERLSALEAKAGE